MRYAQFEQRAQAAWNAIPEAYKAGIDGLRIRREAEPYPEIPDIWTLGECVTESYPSDWVGPDTLRSVIVLYFGSFQAVAREEPDFDWDAEIHETLEHELRHHLESLAGRDDLGGVDYVLDQEFRRRGGDDWDPWYWQHGTPAGRGLWVAEDRVFLEIPLREEAFEGLEWIEFTWPPGDPEPRSWRVPRPEALGDLHFVEIQGLPRTPPYLEVVLIRRIGLLESLRRALSPGRPLHVLESEGVARPG